MSATLANKAVTQVFPDAEWKSAKGYRIHLLITRDDLERYSAVALNLPGAGSCGETEEEAVSRTPRRRFGLALESYAASGRSDFLGRILRLSQSRLGQSSVGLS